MKAPDAYRLLESVPVATLATLRADGSPHMVPIVFAITGDRIITAIDGKPKRARIPERVVNIEANPRVCVLAHHYEDDWSQLWWVRVDGSARMLSRGIEFLEAIAVLRRRYSQYGETPLVGPAIIIVPERVVGWSAV